MGCGCCCSDVNVKQPIQTIEMPLKLEAPEKQQQQNSSNNQSNMFKKTIKNKIDFLKENFFKKEKFHQNSDNNNEGSKAVSSSSFEYISLVELEQLESTITTVEETLTSEKVNHLEAGETFYLNSKRRTLWKLFAFEPEVLELQANGLVREFSETPQSELELKKRSEISEEMLKSFDNSFYAIDLDIKRTFPTMPQLNRNDLKIVLENLALSLNGVGYTQGMNFVIGFFLLTGFSAKESYELFIHLSFNKNYLFARNFSEGFLNVTFSIKILEEQMDKSIELKKSKEIIEEYGLTSFFYSFSWILCYFLYSLKPRPCILVWDFILTFQYPNVLNVLNEEIHQDPKTLYSIKNPRGSLVNVILLGIEIMKKLSPSIMVTESAEELLKLLRNENLAECLNEEVIESLIQNIHNNFISYSKSNNVTLDLNILFKKMETYDKDLYEILSVDNKYQEYCYGIVSGIEGKRKK